MIYEYSNEFLNVLRSSSHRTTYGPDLDAKPWDDIRKHNSYDLGIVMIYKILISYIIERKH